MRLRFIPTLAKFVNLDTFDFGPGVSDDNDDMRPTITRMSSMNEKNSDVPENNCHDK